MRRSSLLTAVALLYFISTSLVVIGLRTAAPATGGRQQTFEVLRIVPDVPAPSHSPRARPRVTLPQAHAARAPHPVIRRVSHRAWLRPGLLMRRAIARIPGYRPGMVRWVLTARYGHWGATDLDRLVVYISPYVPRSKMYDVVVHEWSHVLSVLDYDRNVDAMLAAVTRVFGGSGLLPAERAADCMARLLGARWTGYTSCARTDWRAAARRLLAGDRV